MQIVPARLMLASHSSHLKNYFAFKFAFKIDKELSSSLLNSFSCRLFVDIRALRTAFKEEFFKQMDSFGTY